MRIDRSQSIPALVLTYDRYRVFADHMIHSYEAKWPGHPFVFHVPFQREEVRRSFEGRYGAKVKTIPSPPGIRGTMDALLDGIGDEDWVYWCMDDRFLIWANCAELQKVYDWLTSSGGSGVDGVKCITRLGAQLPEHLDYEHHKLETDGGHILLRRKTYLMIWIHQFLRAKVLRDVFANIPEDLKSAKEMDYIVDKLVVRRDHRLYSLSESLMILGESTTRGAITANCLQSLVASGFRVPEGFAMTKERIVSGESPTRIEMIMFCAKQAVKHFFLLLRNAGFQGMR